MSTPCVVKILKTCFYLDYSKYLNVSLLTCRLASASVNLILTWMLRVDTCLSTFFLASISSSSCSCKLFLSSSACRSFVENCSF